MNNKRMQVKLIQKTALLMFVAASFGSLALCILPGQPLFLMYWSIVNAVLTAGIVLLVYRRARFKHNGVVVMSMCLYLSILPATFTGGVNSQFAAIIPLLSMVSWLVVGRTTSTVVFATTLVALSLMAFFDLNQLDLMQNTYSKTQIYASLAWLVIATSISFFFGLVYSRINNDLSEKLKYQAFNDALTGIHNRRSILHLAEAALFKLNRGTPDEKTRTFSVLLIDIDHFKRVNDEHGHDTGDECLVGIAKKLARSIRSDYDAAGRYGGEEFLVCLQTPDETMARTVAEKLRLAVSELSFKGVNNQVITPTASIGLMSVTSGTGIDVGSMISLADKALYQAKSTGRNKVVSFSDIQKSKH